MRTKPTIRLPGFACAVASALLLPLLIALSSAARAQNPVQPDEPAEEDSLLGRAKVHMQAFEMRLASSDELVDLNDRPLLTYGDSARANKNGTVWAFGKSGRPLAMLELYQGMEPGARWIHAVTLTGARTVSMKTPIAGAWKPDRAQIEPAAFPEAALPEATEARRLRQIKELARRFTAHEFWDPDNSRFELRLLVQPVLRYRDEQVGIHDGAVLIMAHGTNPEVVLLIEAIGPKLAAARWHYSLARLGSAELHVELGGKEVWKQERTPGVVGRSVDPYWLFLTPPDPPSDPPTEKK